MMENGDRRIVVRDIEGGVHFRDSFQNVMRLRAALSDILDRELRSLASVEEELICRMYEDIFKHDFFCGRSESMYKYEGINCIYWHMVSKLLLAVREVLTHAVQSAEDENIVEALRERYREIRAGLGMHKTPAEYGAVPIDPYSHTPDFAGAQQPGMTGQVKEDFLARMGEMGMTVRSGEIHFIPQLMTDDEFLATPADFRYWDLHGREQLLRLSAGTLAFTCCQLPVVLHRHGAARIDVSYSDGSTKSFAGGSLDRQVSRLIFQRTGEIRMLDVYFEGIRASQKTEAMYQEERSRTR
jgi:hypothetical protein